jgi:ABC-type glutathione transport system ATPase component
MMTGQILGGSPVMEAAWYQILIMYLIAICAFGTILTVISLALRVGFDFSTATLRSDRLIKRKDRASFLDLVSGFFNSLFTWTTGRASFPSREMEGLYSDVETYSSPKGQLRIETLIPPVELSKSSHVEVLQVKRSFQSDDKDERMVLFHNVSIKVGAGEIMLVGGPSGTGKSQLLRLIAGLSPLEDEGDIFLDGISFRIHYKDVAVWRQRVRYVTQYKIDIPGSPKDFVKNITRFSSWNHKNSASPSKDEMLGSCYELLKKWGMEASYLEKEWLQLSGGEAQRVIVAIALASRPQVLLMDESTSALDLKTKIKVEESIVECASRFKMSVLWVSHDTDQVERMRRVSRNGP